MSSKGQSMAEYGLIAALVAVVSIAGLQILGNSIFTQMSNFATGLSPKAGNNVMAVGLIPNPSANNGPNTQVNTPLLPTGNNILSSTGQKVTTSQQSKKQSSRSSSGPATRQVNQAANQGCNSSSCLGSNQVGI